MKRRDFLAATSLAGLAPLAGVSLAQDAAAPTDRQYIELRTLVFADAARRDAYDGFLRDAAVPAWNRMGIQPVGIFPWGDAPAANLFVILPHPSLESALSADQRILDDASFLKAGAAVLEAPFANPALVRYERSLLRAFASMPRLVAPVEGPDRVYQLRIYQSHTAAKHLKKVAMFEAGGEIEIFRRVGLNPVFFSQALFDTRLPNVTYMVAFQDQAALEKSWDAFRADPAWLALRDAPEYKDTVLTISNFILKPTAASQM